VILFIGMAEIFGHMRSFRERMAAGELLSGPFVSLTDPTASEALAGSVDFLWYDQEHTPMSPEALSSHLLACRTKKTPAFVRITGPNDGDHQPWGAWIKPVLDMGADGVILPQVRTVEEVEGIVADCRFPPVGRRGRGFLGGHFDYGRVDPDQYMEEADAQIFVCVMLETKESLDNIEEIMAVPGLDSVCVGANDLMSALGLPYPGTAKYDDQHHAVLMGAVERCVAAAEKAGKGTKFVGFATGNPIYAADAVTHGAHWIQIGADKVLLKQRFEQLSDELEDAAKLARSKL
jgi:2-keto-3-deoxy-L-rhamnonate aldolase RhmA